jgi:hypothetical protein
MGGSLHIGYQYGAITRLFEGNFKTVNDRIWIYGAFTNFDNGSACKVLNCDCVTAEFIAVFD